MIPRRALLKGGACALVALGSTPRFLVRAAGAATGTGKVLVAVFQRGAVDGLSMVVPYGDPACAAARTSIAIKPPARGDGERAIDLDGFFALHPALAPLAPLWSERTLAVVHACGSPDPTRSHFDAQDYMESGTPGVKSTPDGWLGRSLQARPSGTSPFRAVAIGPALPRALRGAPGGLAMSSIERFDIPGAPDTGARQGFETLYAASARPDRLPAPTAPDPVRATGKETFDALRMLQAADASRIAPANGATYPSAPFGQAMRQIAQLIRANIGVEIAFAEMDGWDTHVAQGAERGQLAARLGELAAALAAFTHDLGDRMADVVVLTMSEFGRTVAENGNGGTDHGHATAMLVLGGGVRGGQVYGRWPGLGRERLYEGRDLAVTTDFRTLFAEIVTHHLGIRETSRVFPGWPATGPALGVMR